MDSIERWKNDPEFKATWDALEWDYLLEYVPDGNAQELVDRVSLLLRNAKRETLLEAAREAEHWQKISGPTHHKCGQYIAEAIRALAEGS